jgi:hypothetical protein
MLLPFYYLTACFLILLLSAMTGGSIPSAENVERCFSVFAFSLYFFEISVFARSAGIYCKVSFTI